MKPEFIAVHGAHGAIFKVEVFKKPLPGTRADHIRFTWRGSKEKMTHWVWINDAEVMLVIQMLAAAISKRMEPDIELTLLGADANGKRRTKRR